MAFLSTVLVDKLKFLKNPNSIPHVKFRKMYFVYELSTESKTYSVDSFLNFRKIFYRIENTIVCKIPRLFFTSTTTCAHNT